ncbi:MAG: glycosyltransferase family 2 protein [Bacteroidales bacterium]|nr:glycosyltransferase family 2 protein [Bacteroidales bacterium]
MKKNNPLVSVCIISYNSSNVIVETLESIKNQTYKNIELIISDDCSTDNTVEVCEKWLDKNKYRFSNGEIITSPINTGTSINLNRGLKQSNGIWVKIMAADDLLFPHSIDAFLKYSTENNKKACVSKLDYFGNVNKAKQKEYSYDLFYNRYSKLDVSGKYKMLLSECLLPMPGLFILKELLVAIDYIDEKYTFGEEWPTYMKILERNIDLAYFDEKLVSYRSSEDSLSGKKYVNTDKGVAYTPAKRKVFSDSLKFFNDYRKPQLKKRRMYLQIWSQILGYKMADLRFESKLSVGDKIKLTLMQLIYPVTYTRIFQYIHSGRVHYIFFRLKNIFKF